MKSKKENLYEVNDKIFLTKNDETHNNFNGRFIFIFLSVKNILIRSTVLLVFFNCTFKIRNYIFSFKIILLIIS